MGHQATIKRVLLLLPVVALAACLALSTASAQTNRYALLSFGIGSGGQSSGGEYSLVAHITQPGETMSGGTYEASGEFQAVVKATIHQVYLPVIMRTVSSR